MFNIKKKKLQQLLLVWYWKLPGNMKGSKKHWKKSKEPWSRAYNWNGKTHCWYKGPHSMAACLGSAWVDVIEELAARNVLDRAFLAHTVPWQQPLTTFKGWDYAVKLQRAHRIWADLTRMVEVRDRKVSRNWTGQSSASRFQTPIPSWTLGMSVINVTSYCIFKIYFFFLLMCTCLYELCSLRPEEDIRFGLALQAVVSYMMRMLGIELGSSSRRAVRALKFWAVSPAQKLCSVLCKL